MARIAKKTTRYPSDLTDEEWERIAPLMPRPGRRGRPREVEFREVMARSAWVGLTVIGMIFLFDFPWGEYCGSPATVGPRRRDHF